MMLGDLPPNSSEIRVKFRAASSMIRRPTSVEPVNDTLRTSGWVTSASPKVPPGPVITCRTPAGSPAAWASSPNFSAVSGEMEAGFSNTAFPAASAGATFQQAMAKGKFHGTMAEMTPSGWRSVKSSPPRATGIV